MSRSGSKLEGERRASFYIFLTPWIIGFLLLLVIPICWGFWTSLTNRMAFSTNVRFIGLANYVKALKDPEILYAFQTTFLYALLHTCLAIIMGLIGALLLEREVPGRGVFRTILYFPYMIPIIAVGWIFRIFLERDTGFFNIVLMKLHLIPSNIAWLASYPLGSIISLAIWQSGWSLIIFLGGLSTIPNELYESATIDGAHYFRRFSRISLPLLSPFIFFQFVSSMIYAMQTFIQSFILNSRQLRGEMLFVSPPPRETFFVMARGFFEITGKNRFAYGLSILWMLFVVVLLITIIFIRLGGFVVYTEVEEKR
jgi:multiple sugar transport system permease protein